MITSRQIPTIPRLQLPLSAREIEGLSRTLTQLRDAIQQLPQTMALDVTIQAPLTTAPRIATGLQIRPRSVTLGRMEQVQPIAAVASIAGTLQWSWDGGYLTLPQLAGLTGTGTYALRLLIEEG